MLIAVKPPPPMPATTRPTMMTHSSCARPHIRFPRAKKTFEKIRPVRLDRISVRRPLSGWRAALAIRYADASQESRDSELNDVDIGAERVAIIVESGTTVRHSAIIKAGGICCGIPNAARKLPIQIDPRTSTSFPVLSSSAIGTSSSPVWFSPTTSAPLSMLPWSGLCLPLPSRGLCSSASKPLTAHCGESGITL